MSFRNKILYLVSFIILFSIFQNSFGLKLGENEVSHDPVDEEYKYYTRWYTGPKPKGSDNHAGVDIVGEFPSDIDGKNVYSVEKGKVIYAGKGKYGTGYGGFGNVVAIKHDNGYITVYGHLKEINEKIVKGSEVNAGDDIGAVGNTGNSDGPHLHYEVRNNNKIDLEKNPLGQVDPGDAKSEEYTKVTRPQDSGGEDDSMDGEDGEEDGDGVTGTNPGGERPDDNKSSSTNNPSYYTSASKSRFYRLAPKKGKPNVLLHWNFEKLLEERVQYFESVGTGGSSDEAYLVNLNTRINEAYNLLSKNSLQYSKERSETPDVVILRHGYFGSASSLIGLYKDAWRRVPPSFSPLWVKENPVMVIPTGGLYGMEKSEIFKAVLEEYVRNGGTIIVFTQQHGYEFSVLPTPDGEPIVAYGWREDQSCSSNSMYVDAWHPALSSTTRKLIGNPVDGYFSGYPSDSTVLLRRRVNGMPALLSYPYGEGWVVVTSLFTDWVAFFQDRKIIRNLIAWAKNPDLEIPEYNLRDNPDPEVSLNLEIKNLSDKTASKAKILWLDPERNLAFEEEKLVSIPSRGITIPENCIFSETSIF